MICRQNPSNPVRPDKLSRFVGLSKKHNRWKALIKVHGKRKELGSFTTEEAAARCYDRHAVLAWGARCVRCTFLVSSRCIVCRYDRNAVLAWRLAYAIWPLHYTQLASWTHVLPGLSAP